MSIMALWWIPLIYIYAIIPCSINGAVTMTIMPLWWIPLSIYIHICNHSLANQWCHDYDHNDTFVEWCTLVNATTQLYMCVCVIIPRPISGAVTMTRMTLWWMPLSIYQSQVNLWRCDYDHNDTLANTIKHIRMQGILKGEVSLYHWPPVWLLWIGLVCFTNKNVQWHFPFSIPWPSVISLCSVLPLRDSLC